MTTKVCLRPVDRNVSTINVGGQLVFEVFKTGVTRLLCETGLVSQIEEASDTVLTGFKIVILDKSKSTWS